MTAARAAARSITRGGGYKLSRRVSGATNGGGDVDTFPRASAQARTALVNAEAAARVAAASRGVIFHLGIAPLRVEISTDAARQSAGRFFNQGQPRARLGGNPPTPPDKSRRFRLMVDTPTIHRNKA